MFVCWNDCCGQVSTQKKHNTNNIHGTPLEYYFILNQEDSIVNDNPRGDSLEQKRFHGVI